MSFVGTANRIGAKLVRPHDVQLSHVRMNGCEEAMIDRIVHLGFEVRIELTLADDEPADRAADPGAGRGARARRGSDRLRAAEPRAGVRLQRVEPADRGARARLSMAVLIAWAMFAVLIGWLGVVLWSTFRTIDGERARG